MVSQKQVAYPTLAWIVFFSGREQVGEYFTTIYDAYSGAPVLNVVVVWWGPKGPSAPPASPLSA